MKKIIYEIFSDINDSRVSAIFDGRVRKQIIKEVIQKKEKKFTEIYIYSYILLILSISYPLYLFLKYEVAVDNPTKDDNFYLLYFIILSTCMAFFGMFFTILHDDALKKYSKSLRKSKSIKINTNLDKELGKIANKNHSKTDTLADKLLKQDVLRLFERYYSVSNTSPYNYAYNRFCSETELALTLVTNFFKPYILVKSMELAESNLLEFSSYLYTHQITIDKMENINEHYIANDDLFQSDNMCDLVDDAIYKEVYENFFFQTFDFFNSTKRLLKKKEDLSSLNRTLNKAEIRNKIKATMYM